MLFYALLFISGIYYVNSVNVSDNTLVYETVKALLSLLNFTEKYLNYMNLDGLFGMTLAEASLNDILQSPLSPIVRESLEVLRKGVNDIQKQGLVIVQKSDLYKNSAIRSIFEKMQKLLKWKFWSAKNVTFISNQLTQLEPKWEDYYFLDGSPQEFESDYCITQILKLNENETKACPLNSKCKKIYFDTQNSHGYPLTHKLLLWSVFSRFKCTDYYNTGALQRTLCSRILSESAGIMQRKPFLRSLSDLFLEQVTLCGVEGYTEFFEKREWLQTVLAWQNEYGCFESFRPSEAVFEDVFLNAPTEKYKVSKKLSRRMKRGSTYMAHGCENHITGLAFAFLTLNLKYILTTNTEINFL